MDIDDVNEKKKDEFNDLFEFIKSTLEDKVKEVKPSTHLNSSISCLSGDAHDMSAYMEKILKSSGQSPEAAKRILELNMDHPALEGFKALFETDKEDSRLKDYSRLIFDMALISEGGKIDDPADFSKRIGELMANAMAPAAK